MLTSSPAALIRHSDCVGRSVARHERADRSRSAVSRRGTRRGRSRAPSMPAVKDLPIVSPHGHTDPRWYALERAVSRSGAAADRARPLYLPHAVQPGRAAGGPRRADARRLAGRDRRPRRSGGASPRTIISFAARRRGCGSTMSCPTLFGIDEPLTRRHRRRALRRDRRAACQRTPIRPRALFERFNIEVIATTEGALDDLRWHRMIRDSGWNGRVVTAYRPGRGRRSGFRGLCRQSRPARRDHRLRHRHLGRLSRRAPRAPRLSSSSSARPPRDHGHPTAETANLSGCGGRGTVQPHPARTRPTSASGGCSAPRC